VAFYGLVLITGCSDSDPPPPPPLPPPPPVMGAISGRLIVPPNHEIEIEPNGTLVEAQSIGNRARVSGTAAASDPGYPVPDSSAVLTDLYSLSSTRPVTVRLTIGANELYSFDADDQTIDEIINDLDLVVLDDQGGLVAFSEGLTRTETIDISTPGDYFIGIRAAVGSSPYVLSVSSLASLLGAGLVPAVATVSATPEFIPGEILMKSARPPGAATKGERIALAKFHGASFKKTLNPGVDFLTLPRPGQSAKARGGQAVEKIDASAVPGHMLRAATLEVISRLQSDPGVAWAEPNYVRRAQVIPNDEEYALQWHYDQINLPDAWDTTTGSDNVIVAVLDTGILSGHPDLAGRLIPGYDFVSSISRSEDGDGIDPDAEDPGDDPRNQSSSFHGTHVAGTVGAATNNSIGVAGVTWQTRIMPVRVLGAGGGTSSEVSQGIRYAAGLTNDSDTVPAEPAHIINMSLGGSGTSLIEQEAITDARAAGVVVIAAAGNDSSSDIYSPASLDGVISVSAVGATGAKASYSNHHETVDVAAPGGEFWDSDGDDRLDAIRSTLGDDRGNFLYRYYQGTSMASPHIAGVVALMLAVNPLLTPDDIDMMLEGTHPETSKRITTDLGPEGRDNYFGHGLIDAAAAVIAASEVAGGGGTPLGPEGSRMAVFPASLNFGNFLNNLPIVVSNAGIGTLNLTSATADVPWLSVSPDSGEAPITIVVTADVTGLADGSYTGTVQVDTDATEGEASTTVGVELTVGGQSMGDAGAILVQVVSEDGTQVVAEIVTEAAQDYEYSLSDIAPGTYIVQAGTDRDGDSIICDLEDVCATQPVNVTIDAAGTDVTDIEFLIVFGVGQPAPPVGED
jgi:serine protease